MPSLVDLKTKIGLDLYDRLDKIAGEEVGLAMQMVLIDPSSRQKKYYTQRFLAESLADESSEFEKYGLKLSPLDVVNVLFRCKLLHAASSEEEYQQRVGGFSGERVLRVAWSEKTDPIDSIIDKYFSRLDGLIRERTLISEISNFNGSEGSKEFFEEVFKAIDAPFRSFLDENQLIEEHKILEPGLRPENYTAKEAKQIFHCPSIAFTTSGTYGYAYFYSSAWLRTFFNVLRISNFIHPPQIDFGFSGVSFMAPMHAVFLDEHALGAYSWDEDRKKPWLKTPDGCLFLSFGYRGLSNMWLDTRAFTWQVSFFSKNKLIFDCLKNPWSIQYRQDIAPSLDILSSATQMPDLGAKLLLIYCCLEHLFVPKEIISENKKYIVGGINALRPDLMDWFNRLYDFRCKYAHRGFIIKDDKLIGLVRESVDNASILLLAKVEAGSRK